METDSKQPNVSAVPEAKVLERLGNKIEEFGPNTANLVVGYVFGILLGIAGLVVLFLALKTLVEKGGELPFQAERGASWMAVGWGSVLGVGALVGGLALVFYVRSLFASRTCVCSEGFFTVNRGGRIETYPWSDLERIEETVQQQYVPLQGALKNAVPRFHGVHCFSARPPR
jgi:hypothetical protein